MKLLDDHKDAQQKIFDYFGYVEDWVAIPLDDATDYYWKIIGSDDDGQVQFAETKEDIGVDFGNYYENEIYTQRYLPKWVLPKWVYRAEKYTMICVDTRTEGNKLLQIFDNSKEIK